MIVVTVNAFRRDSVSQPSNKLDLVLRLQGIGTSSTAPQEKWAVASSSISFKLMDGKGRAMKAFPAAMCNCSCTDEATLAR
jgi:hypothetical protein